MKQFFRRNGAFFFLLAIACFTLFYSSTNVTRAKREFEYQSDLYKGKVVVKNIGISLYESSDEAVKPEDALFVARRDNYDIGSVNDWDREDNDGDRDSDGILFKEFLGKDEYIKLGHQYDELLSVYNSGEIPQYCRLIIHKYWTDADGKKLVDREPAYINLDLNLIDWDVDPNWVNKSEEYPETIVLYYKKILQPETATEPAIRHLTVDGLAAGAATVLPPQENPDHSKTVRTVYDYDGVLFNLEVEADAVQTHNAASAMSSAWGIVYPAEGVKLEHAEEAHNSAADSEEAE